jgi:hypothetical protein
MKEENMKIKKALFKQEKIIIKKKQQVTNLKKIVNQLQVRLKDVNTEIETY